MTEHVASRTLVKSPPELWAECSDAASLARHLDGFGDIRITRLEPETAVAWEGERARGTVRIEPSGWGTKVILTAMAEPDEVVEVAEAADAVEVSEPAAVIAEPESDAELEPEPAAEPDAVVDPPPVRRRGFARWFAFLRAPEPEPPATDPEPEAVAEPPATEPAPEPPATEAEAEPPATEAEAELPATEAALTAALDSLGQAHHRPYSRA
ncbi:MAG TPA: hypothetical protein VGF91_07090 [Solirubrobacteraceae bacterium]|jgi:hypothetical protein